MTGLKMGMIIYVHFFWEGEGVHPRNLGERKSRKFDPISDKADRREILPHDRKRVHFYNPGRKIWELAPFPPPQKMGWGQKHAKFDATSDLFHFEGEYLQNG